MKNLTSITALAAASVLLLSACADDDAANAQNADTLESVEENQEPVEDDAGEGVFTFHATDNTGPADELRIELPDGLVEIAANHNHGNTASADETRDLTMKAITVRAGDHPDSQCALEMDFEYNEEIYERADALKEHEVILERAEAEYGGEVEPIHSRAVGGVSSSEMSEDHRSATVPVPCASSPSEGETVTAGFTWFSEDNVLAGTSMPLLAEVEIGVMASGDLHIQNAEVHEEYHYSGDEHGWLHEDQQVDSQGNLIDS